MVRRVDQHEIASFIYYLSNESWDSISNNNDVNLMFNSFLNTWVPEPDLTHLLRLTRTTAGRKLRMSDA
jgi:hypothetical protein